MKPEKVTLDKISLVGISIRTTNKNGQSANDIGQLWGRFFQEQILSMIPNRVSDNIYCVYTDYESDYRGEYTTILGCQVFNADEEAIDSRLTKTEIPNSDYLQFSATGIENVGLVWNHIWENEYPRKYSADFDVYEAGEADMTKVKITTFLAIK